jgi:hypothetical protein
LESPRLDIRHALKHDGTPEIEDARFRLVICSAFVSLLVATADK